MNLANILAFFEQSIPIGIVFLIAHQVFLGNEIKHINKKLDNHITDTHKKVDHLTNDMNNRFNDMNNRFNDINNRFNKIENDMNNRFNDMNNRFDKLYDHLIKNK